MGNGARMFLVTWENLSALYLNTERRAASVEARATRYLNPVHDDGNVAFTNRAGVVPSDPKRCRSPMSSADNR